MQVPAFSKNKKHVRYKDQAPLNLVYGKIPPQAKDLEEAVLGAMMLEKTAIDTAVEILKPECFYVEANQRIYRAMLSLQSKCQPIDILMVCEELRRNGDLDLAGGPYYVTKLTNAVVSAANLDPHCRIIAQKFLAREVIRIAGEMLQQAYDETTDIFDLIDLAEGNINRLSLTNTRSIYTTIDTALVKELSRLEYLRHADTSLSGVPTGFPLLNKATHGWQEADLILLAARPSSGKTAFALNLALNAAQDSKKPTPVAFFSLEMPISKLVQRLLAIKSSMPLKQIKRAVLNDQEMKRLYDDGFRPLSDVPIYLDNTPAMSLLELRAKARNMKRKHNIGLIIIDYLQLMKSAESPNQYREREVASISSGIKALALNLGIPIIALSQLSRDIEKRNNGRFQLSDLRDSGSLEQDADVVMFIHKPGLDDVQKDPNLQNTARIVFGKHRDGELEEITFNFFGVTQKWAELQDQEQFKPHSPSPVLPVLRGPVRDFTEPKSSRSDDEDEAPF